MLAEGELAATATTCEKYKITHSYTLHFSCRLVRGLCFPRQWLRVSTNRTIFSHEVIKGTGFIVIFALFLYKKYTVILCCITRAYYGNMNFFGGPSSTSVKASAKLKQLEEENEDAMFVVVSDVWLDDVEVLEKLNLMFSGQLWHHKSKLLTHGWILVSLWFFFQVTLRCLPPVLFL